MAPGQGISRWLQLILLVAGSLVAGSLVALALTVVFFANRMDREETGPRLTHRITRGDLVVTVTEEGILESSENTEIKCRVRGANTVIWVVESGTIVKPGDVLLRLDTLFMQEQIDERTKYANWSQSAADWSKADVARKELEVQEYEQGTYVTQLMTAEKELVVAKSTLETAKDILSHSKMMAESGYVSELDVDEKEFAVVRAELDVRLKKTRLDVLKRFTKEEQLETLKGNLTASRATHEANVERADADGSRRDRALDELEYCVVKAERGGLVIHPSAARWRNAPQVEEGATVYKDQVLLLMPDLSKMQVKVGIHEFVIGRMKEGLSARVTLPSRTLDGTVSEVAEVTRPAGWWTGNEVRYDTLVKLPAVDGLRPGMSAEVEVIIARHQEVLTVPVAALVETGEGTCCWVKTALGTQRRSLVLGDSNDVFTVVKKGLKEGDEVVLTPFLIPEAQTQLVEKAKTAGGNP